MMFSSNQIFQISGCIEHKDELKSALEFALKFSGELELFTRHEDPTKLVYQILEDGSYCVGWHFPKYELKEGWNEFPFDFDLDIVSKIIEQHLRKQTLTYMDWDGSYEKGFFMSSIDDDFNSDEAGIKNPFYGIVIFKPYTCFYAK